jgi:hypothetical protein
MTRLDRSSKLAVCLFAAILTATAQEKKEPTATELSRNETPAKAILRTFENQEYEFRSAAEAMPATKWDYRPAAGMFKNEKPEFGPSEVRTFAEQVKHVACANFAFAAELDSTKPPDACGKGGPSMAKTSVELLNYLRDSFVAIKKSLNEITVKNMYDPIDGPYAGPNTAWVWPECASGTSRITTDKSPSTSARTESFRRRAARILQSYRTNTESWCPGKEEPREA